ncbi:MAG: tRNA (adenosine(37)-N6)-dimethylallyltransferase MiaA [Candidatus Lokiarchaeota archaeon]|nr:tRNA (adenosine(37)-N6)-dimethylallyltransferase MiaA [Candidatus Lokiarchaeota archaeon]
MSKPNKIAMIVGPTSIGKTEIAIKLVDYIHEIEIVSADSMQIYQHMNIGTAKPDAAILQEYKHHCIDIIDPSYDDFNVMKYTDCVHQSMDDIFHRSKKPLIVGGTGLYIKALVNPIFNGPGKNEEIRKQLHCTLDQKGSIYLFNELRNFDPAYAGKISPNDTKRMIRALEVYYLTGKPISFYHNHDSSIHNAFHQKSFSDQYYIIYLEINRDKLYKRIDQRVDQMIKNGLIEETKYILEKYGDAVIDKNSMQCLGYKQVILYLKGSISRDELVERIKKETRHFAKRQISWFKNQIHIDVSINLDRYNNIQVCTEEILNILKSIGY